MKASDLIERLKNIVEKYGDLPICGGYMSDDTPLEKVILIDELGLDAENEGSKPIEIFFE